MNIKHYTLKLQVITLYGGVCRYCGEDNIHELTMDHIHGDGSKERKEHKSHSKPWRIMRDNYRPDRYQVLCKKCNYAKHTGTEEEFVEWVNRVYENLNARRKNEPMDGKLTRLRRESKNGKKVSSTGKSHSFKAPRYRSCR